MRQPQAMATLLALVVVLVATIALAGSESAAGESAAHEAIERLDPPERAAQP